MNDNSQAQKTKKQKALQNRKILEQLNEIGSEVVSTAVDETKKVGQEVVKQLLGQQEKKSGNIEPGGSVNLNEELAQKTEQNQILVSQLQTEKRLFAEVKAESQQKLNKLRVRLHALMSEASKIAQSAGKLSEQTKVATQELPPNPGEYHIAFIQNLIEYIQTFRKKIDSAVNWLAESNKRGQKMGYWAKYKKHGASFLLSGEHYVARSAG